VHFVGHSLHIIMFILRRTFFMNIKDCEVGRNGSARCRENVKGKAFLCDLSVLLKCSPKKYVTDITLSA
jgi:hypothetical protein